MEHSIHPGRVKGVDSSVVNSWGRLRKYLFGLSTEESSFARRGFHQSQVKTRRHLERIGSTFLHGYNVALERDEPEELALQLNGIEAEFRGFAFEGAAMALTLLDYLTPWRRDRLQAFRSGPGAAHVYMVHVGVGWALARLHSRLEPSLARLDPLLRWLAVDGYGFHQGYFHRHRYIEKQLIPGRLVGYARRVFDQGLGRSLWFVNGADVVRIGAAIAAFAPTRRSDLWSGVGLACAYAGGCDRATIEAVRTAAGLDAHHLAQGVAFAAKTRQRAGNPAEHTAIACEIICGLSVDAAAQVTDAALEQLPVDGKEPAYQVWRFRIQSQFAKGVAGA